MNAGKGLLALGGCGLVCLLALLALGGLASSVASSAANISGDASSIAASMAIADSARSMSQASIAASAVASAANFNVTLALCLGGLMGSLGLAGGAVLAVRSTRRPKTLPRFWLKRGMSQPPMFEGSTAPGLCQERGAQDTASVALLVEDETPLDFREWGW